MVSKSVSAIMGKAYYVLNLARHLDDFYDKKRGLILQKTGDPRRYRFRFINALMEPFVIFNGYAIGHLTD